MLPGSWRFCCVQLWNANGTAWIMSAYSAILDAINRGPIQGDHIASKTDDAVDRRSALAEQLHRESQPRGSFSGDLPRLPLRSASFPDLAGDDPQRTAGGRGPDRDRPDHLPPSHDHRGPTTGHGQPAARRLAATLPLGAGF